MEWVGLDVENPTCWHSLIYCCAVAIQTSGHVTTAQISSIHMANPDLPSLPHLAGDSRILDSISRSPAASSKSPAFYKQSHFPLNSTAKIAPRMHQNSPFWTQKSKNFLGRGWGGTAPSPVSDSTSSVEGNTPFSKPHPPQRLRRLTVSIFDVSVSPSKLVSR